MSLICNKAVVAINIGAFDDYTGKVFVPGSVTSIAEDAFSKETEVYFEADTDYQNVSESLITGIGTENIYFNIIAGLKAADVVQTFDYPMYVENGKGIYDTEINSEEEFIAVYQYCWLYNIGSLNLGVGAESSGGETQVPYYVIIAASFNQIYKDDTIKLIMLDEAFDKMDDFRIDSMLHFFTKLGFQMILATPPQRVPVISESVKSVFMTVRQGEKSTIVPYYNERV